MNEYTIGMAFVDQSQSFCLGFEAGILYEKLKGGEMPDKYMVHTENLRQIKLMVSNFNLECFVDPTEVSEWVQVTFTTKFKTKPQLRVV